MCHLCPVFSTRVIYLVHLCLNARQTWTKAAAEDIEGILLRTYPFKRRLTAKGANEQPKPTGDVRVSAKVGINFMKRSYTVTYFSVTCICCLSDSRVRGQLALCPVTHAELMLTSRLQDLFLLRVSTYPISPYTPSCGLSVE